MAEFDVIFLGGGPAGYLGALRCAQLGLATAVVEREGLGGTCVLWGCIPAKALLESAHIASRMAHVAEFGIGVGEVKLDYGVAMRRSRAVAAQNSRGVEFLFRKHKVTWIRGTGRLTGKGEVQVTPADGAEAGHRARRAIVIATGSRVRGLPRAGLELDRRRVLSSDDALVLERAPASMIIVGAGAVGCEFADVFNAFGTRVTLVEVAARLLPLEDEDSSTELARAFRKRNIELRAGATITGATVGEEGVTVTVQAGGERAELAAETVLVAAGRAPNVEGIGLEEAGVQRTDAGFVRVNERFETSAPGVYAVGDVVGGPMLAHKGYREGRVLADLLAGQPVQPINYRNIPRCTYCFPEVASTGLTEAQCREKGLDVRVGRFAFAANGRARTTGETEGFVKILHDPRYGEILGAHIVGPHASELIAELVVARENELTVESLDAAIHAHPTLSEAVAEAVLDSMGKMLHA
ncbi:MAG TPA: dihydrolipoyl dehydrogenase [Longimicrobium sp.]